MPTSIRSAVLLCSLFTFTGRLLAMPAAAENDIAVVIACQGDVKVVPGKSNIGIPCVKGGVINPGDWMKTGPGSAVTLAFDKKFDNLVTIQENSLTVVLPDGYFNINLIEGAVFGNLENIKSNQVFRIMTPATSTEASNGGWCIRNEGPYTDVSVVDGVVFVSGVNPDGTVKGEKSAVEKGFGRKTTNSGDPGELEATPGSITAWFQEQVIKHREMKRTARQELSDNKLQIERQPASIVQGKMTNGTTIIADGREVDLVDFIYQERVKNWKGR
ncbi:MAG: hypothetical protein HQL30_11070 [Candidatus Omnitrophica bacterium]|nr:hypothetical protein [Candidatus Omnitrophota bacterium]